MARKQNLDEVWDEIFDSLVLENEPPFEYIKNATIVTKAGISFKVTANDFAQILEREKYLTPEESEILSCRLAINFAKVRKDVDEWAGTLLDYFDSKGNVEPSKKTSKKPVKKKTQQTKSKPSASKKVSKQASRTSKKTTAKSKTVSSSKSSSRKKS